MSADGETFTTQATDVPPKKRSDNLAVALLVPLTGPRAHLGKQILNAAHLSLMENSLPKSGEITLYPIDTNENPTFLEEAEALPPDVILGPIFAQEVRPLMRKRDPRIPLFTFSNDETLGGNGIFTLGMSPLEETQRILSFALEKGHKRFVALLPQNTYGYTIGDVCKETLAQDPDGQLDIIYYPMAEVDSETLGEWVARINLFEPQAIFIPDGSPLTQKLLATLKFKNLHFRKVRFLGSSQWDHPHILRDVSLKGLWFTSNHSREFMEFAQNFKKQCRLSPSSLALVAHDAITMIATLHAQGGEVDEATLTTPKGFEGINGPFYLGTNGTVTRSWHILEHTAGNPKLLT